MSVVLSHHNTLYPLRPRRKCHLDRTGVVPLGVKSHKSDFGPDNVPKRDVGHSAVQRGRETTTSVTRRPRKIPEAGFGS